MKENRKGAAIIGISCGISVVLITLLLLYIYGIDSQEEVYLANDFRMRTESNEEDQMEENISKGSLEFTAGTYEIEIHKDVDMSKYLQYSGLKLEDVEWLSDSLDMYVGSDGHVSINVSGVTCNLVAVSKLDKDIKTECVIKTRTAEEELRYQVKSLNGEQVQNDTVENGIVQISQDWENSQMINIEAMNYKPLKRDDSYVWDSTLFYQLEDIDADCDKDGQINSYFVEKKKFINSSTGNEIEYEIYHNPETNNINKIISIEYQDKKLAIVEYYYTDDGKVNFIYAYEDVNYTPSYAMPNREGERYLYENDTMVTWRIIEEGNITNYCVTTAEKERLEESSYNNVKFYSDCDNEEKALYDEKETIMLNHAYNTLEKMENAEGISTINGYLSDSTNVGIGNATVQLLSVDYNCNLYTTATDENGFYEIMVPAKDMDYSLAFNKTNYQEENICQIEANVDEINLVQETVYLSGQDSNEYSCGLAFYDALNKSEDGYGMKMLDDLELLIRRGVNNRTGEIIYENHISDFFQQIDLQPGMYTVQMSKEGYLDSYSSLFVSKDTSNYLEIYATPKLEEDEYRIVLTWDDDPRDLDSHLFIPATGSLSNGNHICFYNMEDGIGNTSLDVDDIDGYGPETTTINHIQNGLYKFYVCDFTDCSEGNEESDRMSNSSATVRVYGKQGLIQTFNVPTKQNGVIWEVFEIRNGTIIPNQRYYDSIGDKTWWEVDK